MSAVASSSSGPPVAKQNLTFEFTKRKRWADLLVTELADAILLILSSSCSVLYCGAAVSELLGWRDDELIDGDFLDVMNSDDQAGFRNSFEESIRTNTELLNYARLRCKNLFQTTPDYQTSPREILFEVKGYPHFVLEDGALIFKCFFATAKPYPSKNTAMLNTFLELKMENERLQQRLMELKSRNPVPKGGGSPHYATTSMLPPRSIPVTMAVPSNPRGGELSSPYYPLNTSLARIGPYEDIHPSPSRSSFDGGSAISPYGSTLFGASAVAASPIDEDADDSSRRKKLKKIHSSEQYVCVTCGRTDSPEWRKGPLGPKTLCNACGLRWAKQMRKYDDTNEGGEVAPSTTNT